MTKLRTELIRRLAKLGVEHHKLPDRDDGFASLSYKGNSFAHFHSDSELDIHLTRSVIARAGLTHPLESTVHPNRTSKSHWIEIRFTKATDLERIIQLVELALAQI